MDYDLDSVLSPSVDLLAFGEPTHLEPAFAWTRNDLLARLADRGFRSIALESDRVAALLVDEYVRADVGTLDTAMRDGFSHGFGELEANRHLVAWMREYNEGRPVEQQLAFYGFDAPTEMVNVPGPRSYLEHVRDYLRLDLDLADLLGADERWHRTEAVMDPAESPGASPEAGVVRALADDMSEQLYTRAPELVARSSRAEWVRCETHVIAGLGLLRYHRLAAQPLEQEDRWTRMCALRDVLMAQNLLHIRRIEALRGPTLIFANNRHLQRNPSTMRLGEMHLGWHSAGAVVGSVVGPRYSLILGSLGRDELIGLPEPDPRTYEGFLQTRMTAPGPIAPAEIPAADIRADHGPDHGYFPLDRASIDAADLILHIPDGSAVRGAGPAIRGDYGSRHIP
ncbi:erythromycin esterase family protein [Nocardia sp. NPDC024068]|uniref:erythromycin esterase family protein n=1 Tax=Nocardia sp. NPDC024068 TaxID=3157197 RepID=UPI0033FABF0D